MLSDLRQSDCYYSRLQRKVWVITAVVNHEFKRRMFTKSRAYQLIPLSLVVYNFIANLSNDIYLPSLPVLNDYFGTTETKAVFTMAAWFLGVAVPQLFWSHIYLHWGARRFVLMGCSIFILASFGCSVAPTIEVLIVARFFQGVGVSSLNVATFTILHQFFDYPQRIKYQNWVNAVGLIAPLLGPLIGGYLSNWFNWRYTFGLIYFSTLPVWVIFYQYLFTVGSLVEIGKEIRWKKTLANILVLLKRREFMRPCLAHSILLGAVVAYLTNSAFIVVDFFGYSPTLFGWMQLPVFASFIAGTLYGARYGREHSRAAVLYWGGWILGISLLGSLNAMAVQQLWLLLAVIAIFLFAYGLCSSYLITEAMSHSERGQSDAAVVLSFCMALFSLTGSLNQAILPFSVYQSTLIFISSFIVLALLIYKNAYNPAA